MVAALLGLGLPGTGYAWTTADIRAATPANWVVRDIAFTPSADGTVMIRYRVTEPAYVNLRVHGNTAPFPLLRQLLIRETRQPGSYEERWDARDDAGRPVPYLQWQLVLRADPVSFEPTPDELRAALAEPPLPAVLATTHHLHAPVRCQQFQIALAMSVTPGRVTVRRLGGYVGYADKLGLSVHVFANGALVGERRLSAAEAGAMTELDVPVRLAGLAPGSHVLHAVITDSVDHVGTASVIYEKK